eukprot:Colp12_sorted_trinity150504_noHs@30129
MPFRRPHVSDEEYSRVLWPAVEAVLRQIFDACDGQGVCFVEAFQLVYNLCVALRYEQLHKDLMVFISNILEGFTTNLKVAAENNAASFIDCLARCLENYIRALDAICKIFQYLEKVYMEPKLRSKLQSTLVSMFCARILDHEVVFNWIFVPDCHGKLTRICSIYAHTSYTVFMRLKDSHFLWIQTY